MKIKETVLRAAMWATRQRGLWGWSRVDTPGEQCDWGRKEKGGRGGCRRGIGQGGLGPGQVGYCGPV